MTGVDPEKEDPKISMSVFEKCCQTPGSAEFIRACIEWGCDVNKVRILNFETQNNSVRIIRV